MEALSRKDTQRLCGQCHKCECLPPVSCCCRFDVEPLQTVPPSFSLTLIVGVGRVGGGDGGPK